MRRNELKLVIIYFISFAVLVIIWAIAGYFGAPWINIAASALNLLLLFILVCVTGFYTKRTAEIADATRKQADASLRMAEENKDARFAALKPIIRLAWIGSNQPNKQIDISFKNIGVGPALNIVCYLTHTKYRFNFKHDKYITMEVGENHNITFPTEDFDYIEWDKLVINCDYKSIYGQSFRSSLKFSTDEERYLEIIELNRE